MWMDMSIKSTRPSGVDAQPDSELSISLHIALLIVSNVALVLVGGLVIARRNYQPLKSRSPIVSCLMLLSLFLFCNVSLLRVIVGRDRFPCFLYMSIYLVCAPAYCVPFILHVYRFLFIFQVSKMRNAIRKLRMRRFFAHHDEHQQQQQQQQQQQCDESEEVELSTTNKHAGNDNTNREHEEDLHKKTQKQKKKKKKQQQERCMQVLVALMSDKFLLLLYALAMLLNLFIFCVFVASYPPAQSARGCSLSVLELLIASVEMIVLGLVLLVGAILVLRIRDGLNIGIELIVLLVHGCVSVLFAVLMNTVPAWSRYVEYKIFSSAFVLVILFIIGVFLILLTPALTTFVWQFRERKAKDVYRQREDHIHTNSHDDDDDNNNGYMTALLEVLHEDASSANKRKMKGVALSIFDHQAPKSPSSSAPVEMKRSSSSSSSSIIAAAAGPGASLSYYGLKRKFKQFCQKEFAQESLLCWDDIEKYKSIASLEKRIQMGKEIQETYIDPSAPLPLNIDSKLMRHVHENIHSGDVHLFDGIQRHLELVMFDTFSRFMQTKQYKEAVESRALEMKLLESTGVV